MKRNLSLKLIFGINSIIILFIILFSLQNLLFLDKYYIAKNKSDIIERGQHIASLKKNLNMMQTEIKQLEDSKGAVVVIISKDFKKIMSNSNPIVFENNDFFRSQIKKMVVEDIEKNRDEIAKNGYLYSEMIDDKVKAKLMRFVFDAGDDYLLVVKPIAELKKNADIAMEFFGIASMVTLIISLIFSIIYARRFTKPITNLNGIAKEIAKQNFSARYHDVRNDEIGELGKSMNTISEELDNAIGELKDANKRLENEVERERQIDQMRKEFISSVSHELRTPISIIQAYAEGMKYNINTEKNRDQYMDIIIDEASKMGRLIEELLQLARMESGGMSFNKKEFDFSEKLKLTIEKLENNLKEKNININIDIKEGIFITADEQKIEQVIVNFINNGINHANREKRIDVKLTELGNRVRLAVFNTGDKIPEEALERVWESFYKVDEARTREYGGIGLGLAIAKAILVNHEYKYGVFNRDEGVEFWFEIER